MKAPSPWAASNSLSTGSYASVTPGLMPSIPRPVNHRPSPVSFNRFRSGLVSAFPKFELAPNVQKFPLEEVSFPEMILTICLLLNIADALGSSLSLAVYHLSYGI